MPESEHPFAEVLVLQRTGDTGPPAATAETLQRLLHGQVISTGDCFGGYEIIEIVPPDEPALVDRTVTLEFV